MIDLGPLAVMLIMFSALMLGLLSGLPVVFTMGSVGVVLLFLLWGPDFAPTVLVGNTYTASTWYVLIAIPLFVFMSMVLRGSGVVDDLFASMRLWLGAIPGGLAMAVVIACVFIAAMSGIVATGALILGIIAVPLMLKYGYSKELAIGSVLAGSNLASLIPPSNPFIVYGAIAGVSIGQLFIGGIIPGLILAGLYILYIGIRCRLNPELGPPLPLEERVGWREKLASTKSYILPLALIIAVLGSIFFGVASATEAAGVGAMGALACATIRRKLNWQMVKEACIATLKISGMVMWLIAGAYVFKGVFVLSGGPHFVSNWVASLEIHSLVIVGIMQIAFFIMGCFMGDNTIMLISLPVFLPIVDTLELSRTWFGVLFLVNIQAATLTPPFGYGLFYMRSVAPEGVTMGDIIRSVLPFLPIIVLAVLLVMFFPELATWLPSLMLG